MPAKYTIEDMRKFAADRGGRCLSTEYNGVNGRLEWACKIGHRWDMQYATFQQGGWCPVCLKNDRFIEPIREIVSEKGGKLISNSYESSSTKLIIICSNNHRFEQSPRELKKGRWCKYCYYDTRKMDIFLLQEKAKERGGKLLTTEYENSYIPMIWECEYGHKWEEIGRRVLHANAWCRVCSELSKIKRQEKVLNKMRKMAEKLGGKCLSTEFGYHDTKIEFECADKHRWKANKQDFLAGSWCRVCADKKNGLNHKLSIEQFQQKAIENGGKLLSNSYIGLRYLMEWECAKGHRWMANGANVYHNNSWCKICRYAETTKKRTSSIDVFQKIAKERGGECLSKKYTPHVRLKFKCSENHVWETQAFNIKSGHWCPKCAYAINAKKMSDSIEVIQKIAKERGGECLSKEYSSKARLKFKCRKNHVWETYPVNIKTGHWCPECGKKFISLKKEK